MSTLHTVNKSPYSTQTLMSCLNHAKDGDAVLMIEDGVYGALSRGGMAELVKAKSGSVSLYMITEDAQARGLDDAKTLSEVTGVSYDGFVDLVTEHDRTQAWL